MKEQYLNKNIIGADETGVGDYLSPLVACAVFVPKENVNKLINLGVVDSKKISDEKIVKLSQEIKPMVKYRIKHLTQRGYNKLNKSFNAHELKLFLHLSAINDIEEMVDDADLIIIDQFASKNAFARYYQRLLEAQSFNFKPFKNKITTIEKGENEHVAVASASILARAFLLELMKRQNKQWNTTFPLGTSKIVEAFIVEFVKQHGLHTLNEVAKVSFKTTQKLFGIKSK